MPTLDEINTLMSANLTGLLGIKFISLDGQSLTAEMAVRPELLAPNGYLHAGAVITLADTTCGFGTLTNLPLGANNFTTIELKSNFLGTAREGVITCTAMLAHGGRTTQIWDAKVVDSTTQKAIALFRCTQLVLYPRA